MKAYCANINAHTYMDSWDGLLAFLDVQLCRKDNSTISTFVCHKATHTDQYPSFRPHHPWHIWWQLSELR